MMKAVDWKQTGIKINNLRIQQGYSIRQAANLLFIGESALKNYLYSETSIPVEILCSMAKLFGFEKSEDLLVFQNNL